MLVSGEVVNRRAVSFVEAVGFEEQTLRILTGGGPASVLVFSGRCSECFDRSPDLRTERVKALQMSGVRG